MAHSRQQKLYKKLCESRETGQGFDERRRSGANGPMFAVGGYYAELRYDAAAARWLPASLCA